ncbi:MAG: hypothetical protein L0Y50_12775, partial [Beijerinckiaceae bacterium]|nr:hypothetical protein [Beijerinckiaceae bacterium]
ALRVRRAILDLAGLHSALSPADFQKAYVAALCKVQNDLGYQGYAPVASNDTINAEANRGEFAGPRQDAAAALT